MEHLRHIFESSRDAIGVALRGVHVMVNPAYLALFGYASEEELIGRPILDLISVNERARVTELVQRRTAGAQLPVIYESVGLRRDGSDFELEVYASTYVYEGALYTLVTLRDVTERNRSARALKESEEKFRLLSEQALMGTAILRLNGHIEFVNRRLAEILGFTQAEMLAWTVPDFDALFHRDDVAFVRDQMQRKVRGEPADPQYTCRMYTKTGELRWMEIASKPITFEGHPAILVSQLDITERRNAEQERALLEESLRQAQKMEAVGRLAGGIAHDFNNLLTGILGNVGLARLEAAPGSVLSEELEEAERAARRAAALTSQLLSFSRKQVTAPRTFDLNEKISVLDAWLRRLVGEHIAIQKRLAPRLPHVKADVAQVEQAVVNLVLNARDAISGGGVIEIATELVTLGEAESRAIAFSRPGKFVRLTVRDNGSGMTDEVRRHLFEPFFTTKPVGKGTGLGLAAVFGALRQADGAVSVESTPGKGSSFHLWFPPAAASLPPEPESAMQKERGGTETVLVVEDDGAIRKLIERTLKLLGYQVIVCEDGPAALAAAAGRKVDLLFTDVIMPGMNGRELAEGLAKDHPNMKVIFTSGYTGSVISPHGVLEPGTAFLQKPYSPNDLAVCVREVLDR